MCETEAFVDLEEAVGSYLNCLSTSCAAGSKLYASVGKIIDEKFKDIFPDHEFTEKFVKRSFQSLQTQNAFEGFQKALLECKEKLLEILIDNHTKRHEKNKKNKSEDDEDYASVALRVAKELYCYHQTVAEILKPLLLSDFHESFKHFTLNQVEQEVFTAWATVSEANKALRQGYGLTNAEIGQILSWQHGEDVSETCRKKLNLRINSLIQQYVDNVYKYGVCEVQIPCAFSADGEELQKALQNCCSPTEVKAASVKRVPVCKEDIEVLLQRELPQVSLFLNGTVYSKASPGKAFENSTTKMRAVREAISTIAKDLNNEELNEFSLKVMALATPSVSNAASRVAVVMVFGKYNLIQVKPLVNTEGERHMYINVQDDVIDIDVPSKWHITEDSALFTPLCREKTSQSIATVSVSYNALVRTHDYLVKRIEPIPIVNVKKCILRRLPSTQVKRDQIQARSKSIKVRLSKATTKIFQRKFLSKTEEKKEMKEESSSDETPIPPPRVKRKAKKKEKKADLDWYSSSTKFKVPPVPPTESKDLSPSVASFEELQGVINFLSGSSSSSLTINEKVRVPPSALLHETKKAKHRSKAKHKKSASFSGTNLQRSHSNSPKTPSLDDVRHMNYNGEALTSAAIPDSERTPGDGMDQRTEKSAPIAVPDPVVTAVPPPVIHQPPTTASPLATCATNSVFEFNKTTAAQAPQQQCSKSYQPNKIFNNNSVARDTYFDYNYQPFNPRVSWQVGLQSADSGKVYTRNQQCFKDSFENQFTPDKQQDFHRLLEGSKFFSEIHRRSWKDRPSYNEGGNFALKTEFLDPWPLNTEPKYSYPPQKSPYQQFDNIESLQLPPNPTGPYMRQNREQLLAKQQILEQYARQQKRDLKRPIVQPKKNDRCFDGRMTRSINDIRRDWNPFGLDDLRY